MDLSWSDEQRALREAVLEFGRLNLSRSSGGPEGEEQFSRDRWMQCAQFGILGLPVPREFGGSELDVLTTTGMMEALGYACSDHGLLFSMHAHLWSVVMPILTFGTAAQKACLLPPLADGRMIGAHGMSEPGSGSDAFSLRTKAVRDGDSWVLTGTKTFVTNAPIADLVVVFATVNAARGMWGVTAFLVDRASPGLTVSKPFRKLGLRSSPLGEVVLDECRVPADRMLGQVGQGAAIFNHSMGWERSCILASQVGRMERQLETCLAYAREREQFGRPIGSFQLVAAKLADMKVRLETSRLLLYRTAWSQQTGTATALDAAMAKLYISEAAVQSGLDAVQIHGGYGFMEEYTAQQELRDAIGGTLYSGTSEMQRMLIARGMGLAPT